MRRSQVTLGALVIAAVARFAVRYRELPETVASHFGADGRANGWMPRAGFALFSLLPLGVVVLVAFLAPFLVARLPVELVNFPNKDYWLAPERRAATLEVFGRWMDAFGGALLVFLVFVYELVFDANARGAPLANGPFSTGLVIFLAFTLGWTIALYRRFGRPPR